MNIFPRLFAAILATLTPRSAEGSRPLRILVIRRREGIGLGDIKLLALISAFLGFWPSIVALFLGLMFATTYPLTQLARRKANALTALPFGSFLAAGGMIAAAFGVRIVEWYKSLL